MPAEPGDSVSNIFYLKFVVGSEFGETGVATLAQLVTSARGASPRERRLHGLALVGAGGMAAGLVAAMSGDGAWRTAGLVSTAASLLFGLFMLWQGRAARESDLALKLLMALLASRLPGRWYFLGDLQVETSWGEVVRIWGVVVSPGGLAVIEPFTEGGDLIPCGHVWMAGQKRTMRTFPSPAMHAQLAVNALRDAMAMPDLPVFPVVVLTDLRSVYHPADTGAVVVGAPHAAETIRHCLARPLLAAGEMLQAVSLLCRFGA